MNTRTLISLDMEEVGFNEPVLVNLLNGNVYDISPAMRKDEKLKIINVPLADYPMLIVERTSLKTE